MPHTHKRSAYGPDLTFMQEKSQLFEGCNDCVQFVHPCSNLHFRAVWEVVDFFASFCVSLCAQTTATVAPTTTPADAPAAAALPASY